jgi:type II secretory pathway pseudopilin PulG
MKKNSGQSLIEMLIIIAVTGIALVAVALAATISTKNARIARERSLARNYIFDEFEQVKQERKGDPETFFNTATHVVNLDPVGTNPVYTRKVTYTQLIAGQQVKVTVSISWEDSGTTHTVTEETTLDRYTGS